MAKSKVTESDFAAIRRGLASLPRTSHHGPSDSVEPAQIVVVPYHRPALDPDRALVVGNRGMGKSFWTRALANPATLAHVAKTFPELKLVEVVVGFDASERVEEVAPNENAIQQALKDGRNPDSLWRAVLVRVAKEKGGTVPDGFSKDRRLSSQARWVDEHQENVDAILTALDDIYFKRKKKLVVVFDALDRLGSDWASKRLLVRSLVQRALAARSYRSIRLKLFMRRDQFEDPLLFQFPDGSKISNQRVELRWSPTELYTLLFSTLARDPLAGCALEKIKADLSLESYVDTSERHRLLVEAIAGEFMGTNHKRGRVFTWLPLHLSDARGETSPRTFLTAWREAALHEPPPERLALDHRGIQWGVSKASGDRVSELREDYPWIERALAPLRGEHVPMDAKALVGLWRRKKTASEILRLAGSENYLPPVNLSAAASAGDDLDDALISDLAAIGIVEVRPNEKINVPDIFRLAAGIKRRGGVATPRSAQRE